MTWERILRTAMAAASVAGSLALIGCTLPADAAPQHRPSPQGDPAVAARAEVTFIAECLPDELRRQPTTLTLACGDANEWLENLTWSGWGEDQAVAQGQIVSNTCDPSCAQGKLERTPVRVVASRLVAGPDAATYRRLEVSATGAAPTWLKTPEAYELPGIEPPAPGAVDTPGS